MMLSGRKALVTGGSLGIGRAIALAFAREGADVAVSGRHIRTLAPVAAEIEALGRRAYACEWDVRAIDEAPARLSEVQARLGGLDTVANNAAVIRDQGGGFPDFPEAEWDYIMDTNLKGLYFVCQAAVKLLKASGGGCIINLASDAGLRGGTHPYGISKWGVVGLTKGMGKQCLADGIRVNGIAPGPVTTRMMGWEPGKDIAAKGLPLGRWSYPEEIAAVAVFLASDAARALAGDVIVVNSGTAL